MLYLDDERVEYPTSDGAPLAETDPHRQQITDLIETLKAHFRAREDVYVSGNLFLCYAEGQPRKHVSPDVLVTLGIPNRSRENYLLWVEGKAPDFVAEITSKSTKYEDTGTKKGLYSALGVKEYVLFDPYQEYLKPRFKAYRLEGGEYLPVLLASNQSYVSEVLGLELRVVGDILRLADPTSGELLPIPAEMHARLGDAKQRAETAEQRAERLAARLRALGVDPDAD